MSITKPRSGDKRLEVGFPGFVPQAQALEAARRHNATSGTMFWSDFGGRT